MKPHVTTGDLWVKICCGTYFHEITSYFLPRLQSERSEHNTTVILCFRIEWHATIISEHQVSCQNGQLYKRQSCHRLPKMNRKAGLRSAPFAQSKSPNTIYKYILPHISMNPMTHKLLLSAIRLQNASSRLNNAPRGHYL